MKIVYSPKNGDSQTFTIDDITEDLDGEECEALEEAGGTQWDTFGGWFDLLSREGYRATKALLWVLLMRSRPELGFEEMRGFKLSEVTIVASDGEVDSGKDESGPAGSVTGAEPTSAASPTPDSAPSPSRTDGLSDVSTEPATSSTS